MKIASKFQSNVKMSELPQEIKQRIIYFLPQEDEVRTSVLSKTWYSAWCSRPALKLCDFYRSIHNRRSCYFSPDNFALFLEHSLQLFADSRVSAESLRLTMGVCSPRTAEVISRLIATAATRSLRELSINIRSPTSYKISIPSSKTLTALTLSGFELKKRVGEPREFPLLRSLSLQDMILDSAAVEELVSSPWLELFTLGDGCTGLTGLNLRRLPRLKRLDVRLAADAPGLESFVCCGTHLGAAAPLAEIELRGCEATLRELSISSVRFGGGDEWIQSLVSKLQALESLELCSIHCLGKLKISSPTLARLVIMFSKNLRGNRADTEIYAPKLAHLEFRDNRYPFYTLASRPRSHKTVEFHFGLAQAEHCCTALWFGKLKQLANVIRHVGRDVVVTVFCFEPLVAIVHEGLSEALLGVLSDLDDSALNVQVSVSTHSEWEWFLFHLPLASDRLSNIFVASSRKLAKYLSRKLPGIKTEKDNIRSYSSKYLMSYDVQTLNERIEFRGDANAKANTALSKAYAGTPFRFTRFCFNWSLGSH